MSKRPDGEIVGVSCYTKPSLQAFLNRMFQDADNVIIIGVSDGQMVDMLCARADRSQVIAGLVDATQIFVEKSRT